MLKVKHLAAQPFKFDLAGRSRIVARLELTEYAIQRDKVSSELLSSRKIPSISVH